MSATMKKAFGWFGGTGNKDAVVEYNGQEGGGGKKKGGLGRQDSTGEAWGNSQEKPSWLKGAVYRPNDKVGKTFPIAMDGTQGSLASPVPRTTGGGMQTFGEAQALQQQQQQRKLRSTLELPGGQVQIMVDAEAARIWSALREISETLIEKAMLVQGEEDLIAKFRQELAVLQIRNPGLFGSDDLCALLNDLSQVDLTVLPRDRAVLALQKILLTMQELSDLSKYNFDTKEMGKIDVSGLPSSSLPDLSIYLHEYKTLVEELENRLKAAEKRAEEAEATIEDMKANGWDGAPRTSIKRGMSLKIEQGDIDADLKRADIQLKGVMTEAEQKQARFEDLTTKIQDAKAQIEQLDELLKDGSRESQSLLRQLLQKQNNAAVAVGMGAGDAVVASGGGGGGAVGSRSSRNMKALLDAAGEPMWEDQKLQDYISKGRLRLLGPSDPEVQAYMMTARKDIEDKAARHGVKEMMSLLQLDGTEEELEDARAWLDPAREVEEEDEFDSDDDDEWMSEDEDDDEDVPVPSYTSAYLHIEDGSDTVKLLISVLIKDLPEKRRPPTKRTKMVLTELIDGMVTDIEEGFDPKVPDPAWDSDKKTVDEAEVYIHRMLVFLQTRMEARGMAVARLELLWEKLKVPEERRKDVLELCDGVSADAIAGLQAEVRRLEDKLARARQQERAAQGRALKNTILIVDQMEPKWMEMQADKVKAKTFKSLPPVPKDAERMMTGELQNADKAAKRAERKRKELFKRFDEALIYGPQVDPALVEKFKGDHMSLAPANLAELGKMIEFVELRAAAPKMKPKLDEEKRRLKILKRDKGMDKKVKRAAVKEKKAEIKEIKVQKKALSQQFKDAKKVMTGIIMTNYLKKKKKESHKAKKKQDAARMKERTLESAKETLRKDTKKQVLELERNIWKSVAMSSKAMASDVELSAPKPREESGGTKRSASGRSNKSDKPVDHGDINVLPGQV